MDSRSEWQGRAELGIVSLNGREHAALGSSVTDTHAVGYLDKRDGQLVIASWDGTQVLGPATITRTWRTPRSFMSSSMSQVTATIDGTRYTGRCADLSMLWKGRKVR